MWLSGDMGTARGQEKWKEPEILIIVEGFFFFFKVKPMIKLK